MCIVTGLVIVNTGEWANGYKSVDLTKQHSPLFIISGSVILTVGLLTFVFSTILGWGYYGEKAVENLLSVKAVMLYRWLLGRGCHGEVCCKNSSGIGFR